MSRFLYNMWWCNNFSIDDICILKCRKNNIFKLTNKAQQRLKPNPLGSCLLQEIILHICEPVSDFFNSQMWRKKWYCKKWFCTLVGPSVGFFIHIGEKINDVARNDIAHLWAQKWFFSYMLKKVWYCKKLYCTLSSPQVGLLYAQVWRKKMILHTCRLQSFFFCHLGEEDKGYCKKWYFTLLGPQVILFYSHTWKPNILRNDNSHL
jgi:hypothetical protein